MNQQKRTPGARGGNPHPQKKPARKGGYFDMRFMTDDEHARHREKYISLGLIKPNAYRTAVEKQTFYGPNGQKETYDVTVVFKSKEECAQIRANLIAAGLLIPKDRRAVQEGRA